MTNKLRISVLDEQTINQIAAGEVVENSSSVVKELVENTIDAGASEVCVETLGGGRGLIRVSDDGCGMSGDELLLSLQRHATSKILKSDDLETIESLGFRGEALPSIASVSKMTLTSGATVEVEGGKVLSVNPKQREGTHIEVRSLFFNTPVRRKFQKSVTSDVAAIHKVLIRLALCHPSIQFRWINEGEEKLFVAKQEKLGSRIRSLLGEEFVGKEVLSEACGMSLSGFVGNHRANRTGQYLFVNGRFVVSPFISQAVLEGCATRLPMGRFPLFVLCLQLPTDWVDVNVHPQKREVRFREKERVGSFVRQGVDHALQVKPQPIRFDPAPKLSFDRPLDIEPFEFSSPRHMQMDEQLELAPTLHPLGVIGAFLLLHEEEGIQIVDLNRARSCLIGERAEAVTSQKLLIPLMLEFDQDEMAEKLPFLEKYGFSLRPFGGKSYACEAIPSHIEQEEAKGVIEELLMGRLPMRSLKKRRFTLEEAKRLAEELFAKGLEKEATNFLSEEELGKRFKS